MALAPHQPAQQTRPDEQPRPAPPSRPDRPAARRRRPTVVAALAAVALSVPLLGAALPTPGDAAPAQAVRARPAPSDVQANLWEWSWPSIARECTTTLGPAGYGGVQVAPPANSLSRTGPDAETGGEGGVVHPWWEVYQPATYELTSRFGTAEQFAAMVSTCRAAGVKVYVDAVINHMTGQGTTSYTGAEYEHTSYPTSAGAAPGSLYGPGDFHARGDGVDQCPSASGGVEDFNDVRQVTTCELLGLADLRTDEPATRAKVVGYLNGLLDLGVSGFRVDAAKHVATADLVAIRDALHDTADGTRPQWALEVFPGSPGILSQRAYTRVGTVLGFDYAYQLKNAFKSYPDGAAGNITSLRVFGEDAGLVPSDKSLVFVQNHDTERGSDTLSYRDGDTNLIADQLMLAYPYGTPQVYSSFTWQQTYNSPPADDRGFVTPTDCSSPAWACTHRDPAVLAMVAFHRAVAGAPLGNVQDDGINLLAFSRGSKGFFAVNNAATPTTATLQTGLRPGTYCDVVGAARRGVRCDRAQVVVGRDGRAQVTVGAKSSLALLAARGSR